MLYAYNMADITVMPSFAESFLITCIESMACGTPVIGSISVPPEVIIEGVTEFRVDPSNYEDLANKMLVLLEDDELRMKFAHESRKHVIRNFSLDVVGERVIRLYNEVSSA
jgi:glycosyltransferase involved in cell wall biosynthesis